VIRSSVVGQVLEYDLHVPTISTISTSNPFIFFLFIIYKMARILSGIVSGAAVVATMVMPIVAADLATMVEEEQAHFMNDLASLEKLDPKSSTSTYVWAVLRELQKMMGMELMIFVLTVFFAFVIRGTPTRACADKGDESLVSKVVASLIELCCGASHKKSMSRSRDTCTRSAPRVPPARQAESHLPSAAFAEDAKGRLGRSVDDLVAVGRGRASVRSADCTLEHYSRLRESMKQFGLAVPQVCRFSRHSPLDLYACLVQNAVRGSKCYLVEQLVDDMDFFGVDRTLVFYEATMKQLASQRHYRLALSMYDRLLADGFKASAVTCSCLVNFAAEIGEFNQAADFFKQLSTLAVPSIRACMTILRVYAKQQNWPAALTTFRNMQRSGIKLDSLALNVVLSTGICADKVDEVEKLVAEALRQNPPNCDIVSFNMLVKGYTQRGDLTCAMAVVERMEKHGMKPNVITFNTMLDKATKACQEKQVQKILGMMRSYGLTPDRLINSSVKDSSAVQFERCMEFFHETPTRS